MSDQEKNITDDLAAEAKALASSEPGEQAELVHGKSPSSAVGWIALLLVIALAGGASWMLPRWQRMDATLAKRVTALEASAGQKDSSLEAQSTRWKQELRDGLGELEAALGTESARLTSALDTVELQQRQQRDELARFSATDRDSWLMAEAEYLLRLANQRLVMSGDTQAAQALLASADKVLRELDNASLHRVRGAVAAELAAVRAVPAVDVEGIYLRLAALVDQAGNLVIFQLPEKTAEVRTNVAEDWQGRLRQGYEDALIKLSDYIIIRRRDVPMQTLMDPQWEGMVRQNLRMLLEQAQIALLSKNQTLYSESLGRAQHWVAEFAESDAAASRAMAREIRQLEDLQVAVPLPDISRSLQALDDAIERRRQQGGGE